MQKFLFVVEIFTKYNRGLLFFAAPCRYPEAWRACSAPQTSWLYLGTGKEWRREETERARGEKNEEGRKERKRKKEGRIRKRRAEGTGILCSGGRSP